MDSEKRAMLFAVVVVAVDLHDAEHLVNIDFSFGVEVTVLILQTYWDLLCIQPVVVVVV